MGTFLHENSLFVQPKRVSQWIHFTQFWPSIFAFHRHERAPGSCSCELVAASVWTIYYSNSLENSTPTSYLLDSSMLDQCGLVKPAVKTCFVTQASLLLLVQQLVFIASSPLTELCLDWLHFKTVEKYWLYICNLYDLCSTQHLAPNYGRGWLLEWTMARKMAQDVKWLTLDSKTTTRYKGVC